MRGCLVIIALTILLFLGLFILHLLVMPSSFPCILPSVEDGDKETSQLYCKNGIKPTQENIRLGEDYQLVLSCLEYHSDYACKKISWGIL